jgi:hypothetical protein
MLKDTDYPLAGFSDHTPPGSVKSVKVDSELVATGMVQLLIYVSRLHNVVVTCSLGAGS